MPTVIEKNFFNFLEKSENVKKKGVFQANKCLILLCDTWTVSQGNSKLSSKKKKITAMEVTKASRVLVLILIVLSLNTPHIQF